VCCESTAVESQNDKILSLQLSDIFFWILKVWNSYRLVQVIGVGEAHGESLPWDHVSKTQFCAVRSVLIVILNSVSHLFCADMVSVDANFWIQLVKQCYKVVGHLEHLWQLVLEFDADFLSWTRKIIDMWQYCNLIIVVLSDNVICAYAVSIY